MSKNIKKVLMVASGVCLVAFAILFWFFSDTRVVAFTARQVITRAWPEGKVTALGMERHRVSLDGSAAFEGVSIEGRSRGVPFHFKAAHISVSGLRALLFFKKDLVIELEGGEVLWDRFKAGAVTCVLHVVDQKAEWRQVRAESYGGVISGSADMGLKPFDYSADIRIDGIKTALLAEYQEEVARQVSGSISGTARVAGDAAHIKSFETELQMPPGARVNAGLLAALTRYLPRSVEKQRLDLLINNGGKLALEVFSFTMKSIAPDQLSGEIKMASREANLKLDLTHDIHTDGTWDGLVRYWQTVLKK